jgi:putative N6-adenine-specific DNA methylase
VAALALAREVAEIAGGVEFAGPPEAAWAANLWLRCATRVLARVGEVEARDFARLRRRTGALRWDAHVAPGTPVEIHASATRCRLYHTGAIAETVALAIADRLGSPAAAATAAVPPLRVIVRGLCDRFTMSVDTSGELLHRRGWREEPARASMRETLAAAMLALCEWDPTTPLVDPMCGAGTLPLEACSLAMRLPPGGQRRFAFERAPGFDADRAERLRAAAARGVLPAPPALIVGSDHDPAAIEAARRNAERAGLAAHLVLAHADLADVRPAAGGPGLVLTNPPYGRRLGSAAEVGRLLGDLGRLLRSHFRGWRAGILVTDPGATGALGLRPSRTFRLDNGGLRVTLVRIDRI